MDLVQRELGKIFSEINNLKKEINTIRDNLDFIKEQNIEILNRLKTEDKGKTSDFTIRENFENIHRNLENLNNRYNPDLEDITKRIQDLNFKVSGKEVFEKKNLSNVFYKVK